MTMSRVLEEYIDKQIDNQILFILHGCSFLFVGLVNVDYYLEIEKPLEEFIQWFGVPDGIGFC